MVSNFRAWLSYKLLSSSSKSPSVSAQSLLAAQVLRSYPTWEKGHIILMECALEQEDVELGFAESLALLQLSKNNAVRTQALLGRSRCLIKVGRYNEALEVLLPLIETAPQMWSLYEEAAAAYLALDQKKTALEYLQKVPESKRSLQAHMWLKTI